MLIDLENRVNQKQESLKNSIFQNSSISIDAFDSDEFHQTISRKFRIDIDFEIRDDLIYYIDSDTLRLCISRSQEEKIFRLAHDENQHAEIYRCFHRISKTLFISRLFKKIRIYVKHCSAC